MEILETTTIGGRIKLVNAQKDMRSVGTCLHNFFAIYQTDAADNNSKAQRVIKNANCEEFLPDSTSVVAAMDNLHEFMTQRYGAPTTIYHELPFAAKLSEQIIRGDIDMLWESERGYVVVDYKSYPGSTKEILDPSSEHYVGGYAPQLNSYKEVVEASGREVLDLLIYYAVMGVVVKIENSEI